MIYIFDLNPGTRFKKTRGVWWANWGDDCAMAHSKLSELTQAVAKMQGIEK